MMAVIYSLTLLLSAILLFSVQPLVGKQLLPVLGGTPSVWNTCLVFFQSALLAGYFYGHFLQQLPQRSQVLVHTLGLAAGLIWLVVREPLSLDATLLATTSDTPFVGLVLALIIMVGWPFVILSATAPLLQRWFAWSGSNNPYWLYVASNLGSLGGLLAYPLATEVYLDLDQQRQAWAWGYGLVSLMIVCCGLVMSSFTVTEHCHSMMSIRWKSLWRWLLLAAIPSSWLMAVTTHLTTDIAPMPLLWVIPLALYLLSFIITFSYWPDWLGRITARAVPMALMFLVLAWITHATEPLWLVSAIHLMVFFGVTLLCHGELAASRPEPAQLTVFYLALSVGGVLGGLFVAFFAPLIFYRMGFLEYPLLMLTIVFIRPNVTPLSLTRSDLVYLVIWLALTLALMLAIPQFVSPMADPDHPDAMLQRITYAGLTVGLPVAGIFALVWRPVRFALALALLFVLSKTLLLDPLGETLYKTRNFFGTLRVMRSTDGQYIQLVHGTTQHGQQKLGEADQPKPRMYYYPTGPIGRVFQKLPPERKSRVGLIGLGCGALAAYAEPGQSWTCFEIDPAVVRLANDDRYFTFLKTSQVPVRMVLGDARRQLQWEPDHSYDLLVLDAFSSDAIPIHLLTREAFELYARKLSSDGVIALHLSNRYLNLAPVVHRVVDSLTPPMQLRLDEDVATDRERADGKFSSTWAIVFRNPDHLGDLAKDLRFQKQSVQPGPIWTDRHSNILIAWKD